MTGYGLIEAQGSGGGGGAGGAARTAPPMPGLEQGNPATTARPVQAPRPGTPGAPGEPIVVTIPGGPRTADQIRTDIQNSIRDGIRNGTRNGDPNTVLPPDFNFRNAVPQGAVDVSIAFFITIAVIIVGLPLARALGRRMDTVNQERLSGARSVGPQIAQLQDSIDAMAVELERISESQRFQSKLMAGQEAEPAKLVR